MSDRRTDAAPAPSAEALRCRLMAAALGRMLDRVKGSRDVLLHLAALERSLVRQGLPAVEAASERVLARVCAQLGSLPQVDEDPALHDLLDRVTHALNARRAERLDDQPFDIERTIVIEEISHSAYMAAEREQHAPTVSEPRL